MRQRKISSLPIPVLALVAACLLAAGCGGSGGASKSGAAKPVSTAATTVSTEDLVARVKTGIIRIETTTCDGRAVGTGFLVGSRLVATVEHVVDGATRIVLVRDGRVLSQATVIGEDPVRDLALLHTAKPISGYRFQFASRAPRLAEDVVALGFPFGLPLTVTKGSVSGLNRTIPIASVRRRQLVQTDAAVNPGNSGGPLLATDSGQVIGLVDLGTEQANGISFAVAAPVAAPLLKAWQVAPQPTAYASCGGLPVVAGSVSSNAGGSTNSDLASYVLSVERLVDDSAAVRKQLVAAVAEANSNRAAAQQAVALVVASRQDEVASAEAMSVPAGAAATQSAFVRAFRLSLVSDLLYQRWVNTRSQAVLGQAQANDTGTVSAKAAFIRLYNGLRSNAGFPPLPTGFPF